MPTIRKPGQKPAPAASQPPEVFTSPPPAPMQPTQQPAPMQPANTAPQRQLAVSVPSFLQQSAMPETADGPQSGYVGFATTKSEKNWPLQQAAGCVDGQPYLYKEKQYHPLTELKFFLLRAESFITCMFGSQGDFKYVSRDLEKPGPTFGSNRSEPHYVGLLLVFTPQGLLPIKGDFKGTKSGGFESAVGAIKAAETPEWAKMSDAHRISCAFPQPFGRVVTSITTQKEISKSNGMPYHKTVGRTAPASMGEMEALAAAFKDADFLEALDTANTNYEARIAFLDDMAKKLGTGAAA